MVCKAYFKEGPRQGNSRMEFHPTIYEPLLQPLYRAVLIYRVTH